MKTKILLSLYGLVILSLSALILCVTDIVNIVSFVEINGNLLLLNYENNNWLIYTKDLYFLGVVIGISTSLVLFLCYYGLKEIGITYYIQNKIEIVKNKLLKIIFLIMIGISVFWVYTTIRAMEIMLLLCVIKFPLFDNTIIATQQYASILTFVICTCILIAVIFADIYIGRKAFEIKNKLKKTEIL